MRHSYFAGTHVVVGDHRALVTYEALEAFHTKALHLVGGSLGRSFRLGYASDHLGEDTAEDATAFRVWGVWRGGDSYGGVEGELEFVR